MKIRRRALYALLILALAILLCVIASVDRSSPEDDGTRSISFGREKTTVRIWYSDESLTDYLNIRAVAYNEAQDEVRIEPALRSGVEFLENVYDASIEGETFPDLYIVTNDALEKAQMAGLTAELPVNDRALNLAVFPQAALNAVTYHGRYVAYPFYFETCALMYNRTYLEALADTPAIPATIKELIDFANEYIATGDVETVFRWDVTDVFYNYFFIGNYMNAGGAAGDDVTALDLYNSEMVSCLKAYQKLNTYFSIDASEVNYDSVVDDFIAGKTVFTVATSDAVTRIRAAQDAGECEYEYGAANIPGLNEFYGTRSMSVTDCVAVNGYSRHIDEAAAFARFLATTTDEAMFRQAGKLPARSGIDYEDENLAVFYGVYENSVPMPKMIETSNLWMRLEIAFTQIWNGADCNQTLKELSENIMKQVTGRHYEEMLLPEPDMVSITDETGGY